MAPRYSIIPGDFATDARADVGHFRVLNLIGRHTDEAGWCRLKQLGIGEEVGLSRKTVNAKIRDLVAWGYVEKHDANGSGRAIWYRTVMDRKVPPPSASGAASDGPECDADEAPFEASNAAGGPVTPALQVTGTCNPILVTPGVTVYGYTERPLLNDLPPLPPDGGNSDQSAWKGQALTALRAGGRNGSVVEMLLAPLLTSDKRLALGKDPLPALRELAEAAHGIPGPALAASAKRLLAEPSKLTPLRIRREIEVARAAGAMIVIRRGTAQWHRWAEHFRAVEGRAQATMEKFDVWQVPSEWPPSGGAATGRKSA